MSKVIKSLASMRIFLVRSSDQRSAQIIFISMGCIYVIGRTSSSVNNWAEDVHLTDRVVITEDAKVSRFKAKWEV